LGSVGIDEIARLKGHGAFIALVTARWADGQMARWAGLPDRKKETVQAFLEALPLGRQGTVRPVCSDRYEGSLQAVPEGLPTTRQVIDRFAVARLYREAADELRKTELKRLRKTRSKADDQPLNGSLGACPKES
jgi:transposase